MSRSIYRSTNVAALIGSALFALSRAAIAQEAAGASAPPAQTPPPSSQADRPARGLTMENVKAKFGTPSQEVPAVGAPPISRWEYPGYVVYFENDRVLHTVVR